MVSDVRDSMYLGFVSIRGLLDLSREVRKKGRVLVRRKKGHWYIQDKSMYTLVSECEILVEERATRPRIVYLDMSRCGYAHPVHFEDMSNADKEFFVGLGIIESE